MILSDFFKALSQIGDQRFLGVLMKGVGLSVALLIGFYIVLMVILSQLGIAVWIAETIGISAGWVSGIIGFGSLFAIIGLSAFLMVPVASAITSFFLEDVADAVESEHYPGLHPQSQPLSEAAVETIKFLGIIIGANIAALIVFLLLPILGPLPFWTVNGYLLGREYFTMVARRHIGQAQAVEMFKTHQTQVWMAGLLMAIPLSVPLLNLLIPTLGAATFTHVFHRLARR